MLVRAVSVLLRGVCDAASGIGFACVEARMELDELEVSSCLQEAEVICVRSVCLATYV